MDNPDHRPKNFKPEHKLPSSSAISSQGIISLAHDSAGLIEHVRGERAVHLSVISKDANTVIKIPGKHQPLKMPAQAL